MKNNAINQFNYTGIVTLSQYKGSKKRVLARIHNEGKYSLFNFIADCLVGDFDVAQANRPSKIRLLKKQTDSENKNKATYKSQSTYIHQISTPEKVSKISDDTGIVRYSFVIPSDKVTSINFDFDHIGLYAHSTVDEDYEQFSAIVSLVENSVNVVDKDELSASSALLVDWELHITNAEKETTDNV